MTSSNPALQHALTSEDVGPGLSFIWYNAFLGVMGKGVFRSTPYTRNGVLVADVRMVDERDRRTFLSLYEMGIPSNATQRQWLDGDIFTIPARYRRTLPTIDPMVQARIRAMQSMSFGTEGDEE